MSAGLLVMPSEREVTVSTKPQSGIVFTQFLASLSGVVKCLGECCRKCALYQLLLAIDWYSM